MLPSVASGLHEQTSTGAAARQVPLGVDGDRERLLEQFNRAVRRPEDFGGLSAVARLLDRLAATEPHGEDHGWIPDTNARMAPSSMLREILADPDIHVAASQYGEDAHRRGWLRPDRTLTPSEHCVLVDSAATWSKDDHSFHEITATFGSPSVTFGSTDPGGPRTLSYVTADRTAPVVAFHLGSARNGTSAVPSDAPSTGAALLAVRVNDDLFGRWEVTPLGEIYFC